MLMSVIAMATLQISSPSFSPNGMIPSRYSCEGANTSPAITIKQVPHGTKSLALTLFDPDAPHGGFVHWVLFNIDPSTTMIPDNASPGTPGKNGKGESAYTGPCPPTGTHHYHFMVYALDTRLALASGATKDELETAMKGHILASGELIGLYKKTK